MAALDLEAIRARAANLADVQAVGDNDWFTYLETSQLWQVALGYAQDVPALLERIAELERENAELRASANGR